jgi:hypothetical protein
MGEDTGDSTGEEIGDATGEDAGAEDTGATVSTGAGEAGASDCWALTPPSLSPGPHETRVKARQRSANLIVLLKKVVNI